MNTNNALLLCLVLHLIGLVLMAGMAVADLIAYGNFWKQYSQDKRLDITLLNAAGGYQKIMALGAVLLIVTGVSMMALTHGIFGEQLWMKIKISIVVLILINGPVLGRVQGAKLKKLISDNDSAVDARRMSRLRNRVNLMSVANLLFLAAIVILSVFKFN